MLALAGRLGCEVLTLAGRLWCEVLALAGRLGCEVLTSAGTWGLPGAAGECLSRDTCCCADTSDAPPSDALSTPHALPPEP